MGTTATVEPTTTAELEESWAEDGCAAVEEAIEEVVRDMTLPRASWVEKFHSEGRSAGIGGLLAAAMGAGGLFGS